MTRRKSDVINLDDKAFALLSEQVKAKEEENRITQQTLTALKRREGIFNDLIERYASQSEHIRSWSARLDSIELKLIELERTLNSVVGSDGDVVTMLRSYASILREMTEELSDRSDRFEIELSRRIGRLENIEIARLSSDIISSDDAKDWLNGLTLDSLQMELRQQYFNLNEFRQQAAKYGANIPIHILNEISFAEDRIAELEDQIKNVKHQRRLE